METGGRLSGSAATGDGHAGRATNADSTQTAGSAKAGRALHRKAHQSIAASIAAC